MGTGSSLHFPLDLATTSTESPAVFAPDPECPKSNVCETRYDDKVRGPGGEPVSDGSLHGGDCRSATDRRICSAPRQGIALLTNGTTANTHNDETGGAASVAAETRGGQDKDDGVHDGFEEVDCDQATDTCHAGEGTNEDRHGDAAAGVDEQEQRSGDNRQESRSDLFSSVQPVTSQTVV